MNTKIYTYYFPNWHETKFNNVWHGKGWTEWDVTKCALPRFEGHKQPKHPLWGYLDESLPEVMEKKIDTAKKYGLDGFIFDWYIYREGLYREDCLEKGFLKARNNKDLEFAIMWANHDAIYVHPRGYYSKDPSLLKAALTESVFRELVSHCIKNYFPQSNYIKIDGKLYFSIFNLHGFIESHGILGAKALLDEFRDKTRKAGLGEMHINVIDSFQGKNIFNQELDIRMIQHILKTLSIDSVGFHGWGRPNPLAGLTVEYDELLPYNLERFDKAGRAYGYKIIPSVTVGWDSSPRTVQSDKYDLSVGYPFTQIVVNNTPKSFQNALTAVHKKTKESGYLNVMTVMAWNEWTEGSYLEPDEENGYAMLEAFRAFKDGCGGN